MTLDRMGIYEMTSRNKNDLVSPLSTYTIKTPIYRGTLRYLGERIEPEVNRIRSKSE